MYVHNVQSLNIPRSCIDLSGGSKTFTGYIIVNAETLSNVVKDVGLVSIYVSLHKSFEPFFSLEANMAYQSI